MAIHGHDQPFFTGEGQERGRGVLKHDSAISKGFFQFHGFTKLKFFRKQLKRRVNAAKLCTASWTACHNA